MTARRENPSTQVFAVAALAVGLGALVFVSGLASAAASVVLRPRLAAAGKHPSAEDPIGFVFLHGGRVGLAQAAVGIVLATGGVRLFLRRPWARALIAFAAACGLAATTWLGVAMIRFHGPKGDGLDLVFGVAAFLQAAAILGFGGYVLSGRFRRALWRNRTM